MVDFQEQDLLITQLDLFNNIRRYCIENSPYESGGLVLKDNKIIYCGSKHKDALNYYPDDIFYLYLRKPENISFSFHSHPDSPYPSDNDIFFIKNYDIPLIIYSLKLNTFLSVNIKNEKINFTWFVEEAGLWKFNGKS